jgi:hypothetical protein
MLCFLKKTASKRLQVQSGASVCNQVQAVACFFFAITCNQVLAGDCS